MTGSVIPGCEQIREALSARIDREDPGIDGPVIDSHLARCDACRSFADRAALQHRRFRLRPATGVPDLSDRILRALPDRPPPRARLTIGNRAVTTPMLGAAALLVAVVLVAGYFVGNHLGSGPASSGETSISQIEGSTQSNPAYPGAIVLPASQVVGKPDVTMTDTAGQPYNLAADTRGRVTLVYFGYTHCPDVCPINMALAAAAVSGLSPADRRKVTVVFVTTDPTRDTPAVIKAWLAKFTGAYPGVPAFVGLTAPQTTIHEAENQIRMLLSFAAQIDSKAGSYDVVHAGYTLIYSQDGLDHLQVTDTETPTGYTVTLQHLIQKGFVAE